MCGIEIKVTNDQWSIRGDEQDSFSRGHICPKAVALQDIYLDSNRLRHPVRRTPTGWQRISWEEALDETASKLREIRNQYGRDSVAYYAGNPTVHNYGSLLFGPGFLRTLRTKNRFSATSVDQLSHHFAAYFMFGHQLLLPIPDIDNTNFLLILGANPVVSNGSLMTAPDVARRLQAIRNRGGQIVVVDPRRTETSAIASRHLFIRPGSDAFLLLALLNVLFAEKRLHPGRLEAFTDGLRQIQELVAEFPPSSVEKATGISESDIRHLARDFASAGSAVCYGRIGVSTQEFGGICQWLINVINIVTGNLDRPGGALFTKPAFDVVKAPKSLATPGHFARWHSRVRKLPEFAGELPVAVLAEEILTQGEGQIRAFVTSAGNPVLSTPNGRKLDEALARLDFMVSIDFYINETTRHAHIILPPTSPLEHDHYDLAFHFLAIRNTAKISLPLFKPEEDAKHDWQILLELENRLSNGNRISKLKRKILKRIGPQGMLDLGLRFGPYGSRVPFAGGLTVKKLKRMPHGIDLGPLQPCLPERLAGRRIQLAPQILLNDIVRLKTRLFTNGNLPQYDLRLIGRRNLRSNNSWMHNIQRLVKGKEQCTLLIHPHDAERLKIIAGEKVRVCSRAGQLEIVAEITQDMMPGVVSIPHGWGHDRSGIQMDVAQLHPGASINDLTDDLAFDALCGTAAFNGTLVRVERSD
ncbi:molybdopterin oxidoreductase family protein [bacterium]|nr:molybdopterin oxidoreductase family protein [bacterium]